MFPSNPSSRGRRQYHVLGVPSKIIEYVREDDRERLEWRFTQMRLSYIHYGTRPL